MFFFGRCVSYFMGFVDTAGGVCVVCAAYIYVNVLIFLLPEVDFFVDDA